MERAVRRAMARIKDLSVPNRQVAAFLDRWVQKNFKSEGGSVGGWTPFKLGGRRIKGGGIDRAAKLLQNTGALRASFRSFWNSKDAGIGSEIFYSQFHEEGTSVLPTRRMLPTRSDVIDDVVRIHELHVRKITGEKLW
jgi:phage gpG-like protein